MENLKFIYFYLIFTKCTGIYNVLKAVMHLSSLFYHISGNLMWYAELDIISKYVLGNISLQSFKRVFSLIRIFFKLILDLIKCLNLKNISYKINEYSLKSNIKNNIDYISTISNKVVHKFNLDIKSTKNNVFFNNKDLANLYLIIYEQTNRNRLCLVHDILRLFVLLNALKFKHTRKISPILCDIFDLISSLISLYKLITEDTNNYETNIVIK